MPYIWSLFDILVLEAFNTGLDVFGVQFLKLCDTVFFHVAFDQIESFMVVCHIRSITFQADRIK